MQGATNGAKRIVAVDVTGLPVAGRVVPANMAEQHAVELLLDDIVASGLAERLELVMVDKGCTKRTCARLSRQFGFEVRQVGWDPQPTDPASGKRIFLPLAHAWRVEVAHGLLMRKRRLALTLPRDRSRTLQTQPPVGCMLRARQ